MTTIFNTEMNNQNRELTTDELAAVSGGNPVIGGIIIVEVATLGFLAAASGALDKCTVFDGHFQTK